MMLENEEIYVIELMGNNVSNVDDISVLNVDVSLNVVGGSFQQAPSGTYEYTFVMDDSYGDGWNGANVDILINNIQYSDYIM